MFVCFRRTYHYHRKNNFDSEDDCFERVRRCLRTTMKEEYHRHNNENIRCDNINQEIR